MFCFQCVKKILTKKNRLCEDVIVPNLFKLLNDFISTFFRTGRDDGLSQIETRFSTIMNEG